MARTMNDNQDLDPRNNADRFTLETGAAFTPEVEAYAWWIRNQAFEPDHEFLAADRTLEKCGEIELDCIVGALKALCPEYRRPTPRQPGYDELARIAVMAAELARDYHRVLIKGRHALVGALAENMRERNPAADVRTHPAVAAMDSMLTESVLGRWVSATNNLVGVPQ